MSQPGWTTVVIDFILLVVSPGGAGAQTPDVAPDSMWLLEPGHAGPFRLGMSVDDLYQVFDRDHGPLDLVDLYEEGTFVPAFAIHLPGHPDGPSVEAHLGVVRCPGKGQHWYIAQLDVLDPRFRTADGIGIGSTYGEARSKGWVNERGSPTQRAIHPDSTLGVLSFRTFHGEGVPGDWSPLTADLVVATVWAAPYYLVQRVCEVAKPPWG